MSIIYDLNKTMLHFSSVLDEVDYEVNQHQLGTAFIAGKLGQLLGLSKGAREKLHLIALFHDIGAFFAEERRALVEFEEVDVASHCLRGAKIARVFTKSREFEDLITYHHTRLVDVPTFETEEEQMRQALILADKWERMARRDGYQISGLEEQQASLKLKVGVWFESDIYEAFLMLDHQDVMTILGSESLMEVLAKDNPYKDVCVGSNEIDKLLKTFEFLVQLRFGKEHYSAISPFVSLVAKLIKLDEELVKFYGLASYLYDIAIPLYANNENYDTLELRRKNNVGIQEAIRLAADCVIASEYNLIEYYHHIGERMMKSCQVFFLAWESLGDKEHGYLKVRDQLERASRNGQIDPEMLSVLLNHYDTLDETLYNLKKASRNQMINLN